MEFHDSSNLKNLAKELIEVVCQSFIYISVGTVPSKCKRAHLSRTGPTVKQGTTIVEIKL